MLWSFLCQKWSTCGRATPTGFFKFHHEYNYHLDILNIITNHRLFPSVLAQQQVHYLTFFLLGIDRPCKASWPYKMFLRKWDLCSSRNPGNEKGGKSTDLAARWACVISVIQRGKCLGVKTNGEVEKRAFVRTAGRKERSGSVQLSALLVPLNAGRCLWNGEPSLWLKMYIWNRQFHKIHFRPISIFSKWSKDNHADDNRSGKTLLRSKT